MPALKWTPERIAYIERMVAEGMSHTQIAKALDADRNAINGVIRREGFKGPNSTNPNPYVPPEIKPRPKASPPPPVLNFDETLPPGYAYPHMHGMECLKAGGFPVLPVEVRA